jgi:large subunit ribosomal protein L23
MTEREPYSLILKPLLTERTAWLKDVRNQYTFRVALDANKSEIKRAIESIFKVKVKKVRTMILPGKTRRMGRFEGKRADAKKAIVTLKEGQKIDLTQEAA